ncbi:endoribonuclease MazF [Shimazuella sp. AN120528]|uniref:endoribonuclease MazF n=1 Tax=Shimazuella soli TaxID=1892854 RepID=UPI001F0E0565|nr:endoribonuclease MazF [Shimazuella soli]MCH5583790.1 endoribonuclease MazF [Shimazuella soli]
MVKKSYTPKQGDIIWMQFNPQAGHEKSGHRPAIVISPEVYNQKTGLAILCPITSKVKDHPFEVLLPENFPVQGAILSDQIKNMDWRVRGAKFIGEIPNEILEEVREKLELLIF